VIPTAEVGAISITGDIDETGIVSGLDRITDQLKEMENQFNQVNQPMKRTAGYAAKLGVSLIAIGVAGVAAMTALATKSPVLATTFAKMEVSTLKLSNTLGRLLKPAFEGVNSLIISANEFMVNYGSTISRVATGIGDTLGDLGSIISGQFSEIDNIIPKTGMAAMGAAAGFALMGPRGLFIGAALGLAAANVIEANKQQLDMLPAEIDPKIAPGAAMLNIGEAQGVPGKMEAAFRGSPVEFIYDAVQAFFGQVLKDEDVKNRAFASSDGVIRA